MNDAGVMDFPFVQDMPKRERSKLQKIWDAFQEVRSIVSEKGTIIPATAAAELLEVSRQCVHELVSRGKLEGITWRGHLYITERSLLARAESEREKGGRPANLGPVTLGQCVSRSIKGGKAYRAELLQASKKTT